MYTPEEWHQTQLQIVAELCKNKKNKGKLKFIACPPRPPDLNPIELVWDGQGQIGHNKAANRWITPVGNAGVLEWTYQAVLNIPI